MEFTKRIKGCEVHVLYPIYDKRQKLWAPAKVVDGGYINPFKEQNPIVFKTGVKCKMHCDTINLHNGWNRHEANMVVAASMNSKLKED